jgi:hypothetical protein
MKTLILIALVIGLLAALPACQYGGHRPAVEREPYTGPEIRVDTWGTEHRVILTAPTGGWRTTLDQVRRADGRHEVFVTATQPDPELMVTQALARHELETNVDSRTPIDVYARLVDHGANPADYPYRLAARAQ